MSSIGKALGLLAALAVGCGGSDGAPQAGGEGGHGDGGQPGAGGHAGEGGHAPGLCDPGAVEACAYGGPAGTEDVGVCRAGHRTCAADGSRFSACTGEITPSDERCDAPADEDCDGVANDAAAHCALWQQSIGGPGAQVAVGVHADRDGDVFVAGWFEGTVDFGDGAVTSSGKADAFLVKLDKHGALLAKTTFGGAGDDKPASLACGPDFCAVVGVTDGAIDVGAGPVAGPGVFFVAVAVDDFTSRTANVMPTTGHVDALAAADDSVSVKIGLTFDGTVTVNAKTFTSKGGKDILLVPASMLPATLDDDLTRQFGDEKDQVLEAMWQDGISATHVGGRFDGALDLGDGAMTAGPKGALFYGQLGAVEAFVSDHHDGEGHVNSIAVDANGQIYVGGSFSGAIDFGAEHLTSAGGTDGFLVARGRDTVFAAVAIGGAGDDEVRVVVPPATAFGSELFALGHVEGEAAFGALPPWKAAAGGDFFVARFTSTLGALARTGMRGALDLRAASFQPFDTVTSSDVGGDLYVVGGFSGAFDLGPGPMSAQASDALVARFSWGSP